MKASMNKVNFEYSLPVSARYDVIVAGGGPAGFSAAVAASRNGSKTLLIEAQGALGGQSTSGSLPFFLGAKSQGREVVKGIFSELVKNMVHAGDALGPARTPAQGGKLIGLGVTDDEVMFDPEKGKKHFEDMALNAGVELLYFSSVIDARVTNNKINGVLISNKSGLSYIEADFFIDCTGDADMTHLAGYPTVKATDRGGSLAPATLIFHVEDVDANELAAYLDSGGDKRFRSMIKELKAAGIWKWPKDVHIMFPMLRKGVMMINGVEQADVDGTNVRDITDAVIRGRRWAFEYMEKVLRPHVPGFKKAQIRQIASWLGVRETRRIVGEYVLSLSDMVEGREFEDCIAYSGYHLDLSKSERTADKKWRIVQPLHINPESGQSVPLKKVKDNLARIPFRSLIPKGAKNLLVAGRCVSVEGQALGPIRVMAPCFAMGQAAGTAAHLCLEMGQTPQTLPPTVLKQRLKRDGAAVDLPETPINTSDENTSVCATTSRTSAKQILT